MRRFENRDFSQSCKDLLDKAGRTIEDAELKNCVFDGWGFGMSRSLASRPLVRNVRLKNCKMYVFSFDGVVFDDVCVDGMPTGKGPKFMAACAFRHVTLKGK